MKLKLKLGIFALVAKKLYQNFQGTKSSRDMDIVYTVGSRERNQRILAAPPSFQGVGVTAHSVES